jgi:hypothetical protein
VAPTASSRYFYNASTDAVGIVTEAQRESTPSKGAHRSNLATDGEGGSRQARRRGGSPLHKEPTLTSVLLGKPLHTEMTPTLEVATKMKGSKEDSYLSL